MKQLLNIVMFSTIYTASSFILLRFFLPEASFKDYGLISASFLGCSYSLIYLWTLFIESIKGK